VTRIRLLFLLNGTSVAVFAPFASVILAARGFDAAAIGLISAITSVAYVTTLSGWGHLGDVVLGRARTLRYAILAAAALLMAFHLPLPGLLLAVTYVAYAACLGAVGPLSDALAVNALRDPAREYGRIRGLASGAFAVAAVALGVLYGVVGYWPAAFLFPVVAILIAAVTIGVPDLGRATLAARRRGGAIREVLAMEPALPRILLAVGLAYVGVFAGFTFLPLRIVELGGVPAEVALSAAVSAAAEVVGMVTTGWMARRVGLRAVFVGAVLLYVISLGLWSVLDWPVAIIASRLISGMGYAGLWIASVMTMQQLLPARFQGSGQALLSMTTVGVAGFLANVVGGLLYEGHGPGVLFGISALLALLGAAVAWTALPGRAGPVPADGVGAAPARS
jgi:PPP family 3-phenylpropionic acid transporter